MSRGSSIVTEDILVRLEDALRAEQPEQSEVMRFAPPSVRNLPLPDYVQHRGDVDPVGKAASEAITLQYAGALKALEAMGIELIDCVQKAQAMAEQCNDAVKYIMETCELYRDESKLIFARIEHASVLTCEVRKVCDELRRKIHDEQPQHVDTGHSHSGQDEAAPDQQGGLPNALVRGHGERQV